MRLLNECDVEKIIKDRFKVSPLRVEKWFSSAIIKANAVSSQSNVYTWRYEKDVQISGSVFATKNFPFFIGHTTMQCYNEDPIGASIANSFAVVNDTILDSIEQFYNYTSRQMIRYGVGTYAGHAFPDPADNEFVNEQNNPWFTMGPFAQVQIFTDAGGAVFLTVNLTFEGFKIYLS